jgi:hypothetical protein
MSTLHTNKKVKAIKSTITVGLALSFMLVSQTCLFTSVANAQGSDQDLLPPEVVPLDPAAASQLSQSQAQARSAQMSTPDATAPGLSDGGNNYAMNSSEQGMTAQQFRKAAFDSLMGQSQAMPQSQMPQYNPSMQPQMVSQNNQMGQSPWMQPGQQSGQMAGQPANQLANQAPSQPQTLSGGVNQNVKQTSGLAGVNHLASMVTMLGVGTMFGLFAHPSPYTYYNTGFTGLGLMNYGLHSGWGF